MAPPVAAAQQRQQQQQQQQGGIGQTITGIIRIAVFWYFASKFFAPKRPSDPSHLISNLFQKGDSLVIHAFLFFILLRFICIHDVNFYVIRPLSCSLVALFLYSLFRSKVFCSPPLL